MAQLEHITPEQVAQYGVVAAPDRLTGRAQDNKAIFDRLVRELVATVVNDIIDKTNELLTAEDVREENESERIAAENLRVEAENLRAQAESIRVENEQARVQAEAARVAAELLRVQAENLRASAENARNTAETAREEAEARRESTANGIVVRATQQAEAAEQSATRASNFEQEAAGYSRSAAESAASASQSANSAAQSAQGAGTSAGNAQASATAAAEAVKHYPCINPATMTWLVWDATRGEFVDTGVIAEGRNGIEADGLWGVYVDDEGFLVVTYTGDDPPPLSISDDGYLVYTLNGQEIRVGKTVGPVGPVGPAGLGVPTPTPESAGMVPAVNEEGDGYELVPQSGGGTQNLTLALDETLTEPVSKITANFSETNKIYFELRIPKIETAETNIRFTWKYLGDNYDDNYTITSMAISNTNFTKISGIVELNNGMLTMQLSGGTGTIPSNGIAINNPVGNLANVLNVTKAIFTGSSGGVGDPKKLIQFSFMPQTPYPGAEFSIGTIARVWIGG